MDQQYVAQTQTSSCSSSSDAANRGDEIRVNDDQSPCVDAPLAQGTHVSPLDSAETVDPARASEGESSVDIAGGPPSARSAHATSTDITDITDSRRAGDGNSSQGHTRSGDGDDIHAGHAPATTNGNDDIIPTAAPAAFNLALDLSSVAPLDRAIVLQFVDVGGKPIRLSHLAASDHLRGLAAARGLELRKPYFVQRSHLYQCIQEDPFNTYVSLAAAIVTGAAAGDESGDHGHLPSSTALHMSTSDKQQQQLSPSSSDAAEYTNSSGNPLYGSPHGSALEKYSRQPAVRELEEKTVAFIQCSEQPVVLSRFAAHQGLRKLARLSGVELKKTFFTDRSGLFRVKEETPGNARVWLAADYNEDGFAPDSTGSREDGPIAPSSLAANVPAAAATSDLSTPLSDHSRTVEPALPSDSGSDSSSVNSSNTPLSMVDIGLLFLHRHTNGKYNPVAMNLFGLDQYLSQVASAEGSVWRRSFFMANHEFFLYHISGSTASITPTKQGHARITHLLKTSDKAQELVSSKNSASTRPVSKSEVLEAKVVEFLKSQPDQRTFLHNVGGDPVLRRLAAEADIALRKPFYESRPNVFRLTYLAETTVMVQLRHSGGGTGNAGAGGSGEQSQRSAAPEQRTATSQPSSTPGASGDTGHLWELLEKEIDTFFLEGKQRQYLLATVGNQPQIKKIASQLQVRVGKEYFMERARQYVLVDSDRAKAMLVGLTPKYYHSLRAALSEGNGDDDTISMASSNHSSSSYHSSGSARVGLGYAPDPTMRRLETIAVDSLLRAGGEKVSLPQLLKDPEMLAIKNKMTTKFDEFFFRRRPHLFSCSPTSSGILSLSLPEMTNRFNPLEQACVATLQRCPSFRSELGSLICSKSLERLVGGYTTADIRIAKAFFSARPDMFQVIQHGSRAEVELAEKYRKKPASAAGSSVIGVRDGGYGTETKPTQDLPTHGSQEISAKHDETKTEESHETPGLGDDEMAAWEEELAGADFHDGDDGDDTSNDDDSDITQQNTSRGGQFGVNSSTDRHQYPYYQQQATAAAAAVASSRQQQQQPYPSVSPQTVLQNFQRFSEEHGVASVRGGGSIARHPYAQPRPWPSQVPGTQAPPPGMAMPPYTAAAATGPAPSSRYVHPSGHRQAGEFAPGSQYTSERPSPAVPSSVTATLDMSSLLRQYNLPPLSSEASIQLPLDLPLPTAERKSPTSVLTPTGDPATHPAAAAALNDEQLDEAETLLLDRAPSLAYALRRKRGGDLTERIADSLQVARLRSELLQLQLRARKTVLCMEEHYSDTRPTEEYTIRVMIKGRCYGEAHGSWRLARIGAMIDAAAHLVLEH